MHVDVQDVLWPPRYIQATDSGEWKYLDVYRFVFSPGKQDPSGTMTKPVNKTIHRDHHPKERPMDFQQHSSGSDIPSSTSYSRLAQSRIPPISNYVRKGAVEQSNYSSLATTASLVNTFISPASPQ